MARMNVSQYRKIAAKKRLSKQDEARIEKWLDPIESEDMVQERVVALLRNLSEKGYVVFFTSIPNSTYTPYVSVVAKNRRMGLNPWMPDLFVILQDAAKRRKILLLELKREKCGVLTDRQEFVIDVANSVSKNVKAVCARGYEQARKAILETCGIPYIEPGK